MKIKVITIGKLSLKPVGELVEVYTKRIGNYLPIEMVNVKSVAVALERRAGEELVLLDAKGKSFDSVGLAKWLEGHQLRSTKSLTFLLGPAEGFSEEEKKRANFLLSLSPMTLQHELALTVLLEQLYRACTILKNEPYHK